MTDNNTITFECGSCGASETIDADAADPPEGFVVVSIDYPEADVRSHAVCDGCLPDIFPIVDSRVDWEYNRVVRIPDDGATVNRGSGGPRLRFSAVGCVLTTSPAPASTHPSRQ